MCGDADWPEWPSVDARVVRIQRRVVPLLGGAPANIWPCAFWAFELRDGKALLVQSFRDPAKPYDGATAAFLVSGSLRGEFCPAEPEPEAA